MTKQAFKEIQHSNRLAVRKAVNQGLAISLEYGAKLAILASIHAAIAPQIKARQDAELFLSGTGRTENQGYVMDLQKYRDKFAIGHKVATGTDTDLAVENEPRFAMIQECAKIAETPIE